MNLFCMTCAGGTRDLFGLTKKYIHSKINVIRLEYSGHGKRWRENFYQDVKELADDMYLQIKNKYKNESPYALFGYSMGCISVVETLKLIIEKNEIQMPKHIFLAAYEPCSRAELTNFFSDESEKLLKKRTIAFGGVPDDMINNKVFWRVYSPVYRADYKIISTYQFKKLELSTNIPLTVFFSESDTPIDKIKLWNHYFIGKNEYLTYRGNHFFINEHYEEIAQIINSRLNLIKSNSRSR